MLISEYLKQNDLEHLKNYITADYVADELIKLYKLRPTKYRKLYEFHHHFNDTDLVTLDPNFYDEGIIIGRGTRNKELVSCGNLVFKYKNVEYNSIWNCIDKNGWEILKDWENIEWIEVRSWILVQNGNLIREIDNLMGEL
tara:strand:+ start:550 stop:972 length:423 start_codon:yes stop_codon:yes gene_type:complete